MCGIVGLYSFSAFIETKEVKKMSDTLVHRGPDGEGQWISENQRVGLGHRRLSIIDLSYAASQPMHSDDGRFVIVLNGEIYNYLELKTGLVSAGHSFRSSSDTEVLLKLFSVEGPACLQKLDGMFAFAVYDNVKQELFCARDRFGEKPFYYYYSNEKFLFASEMKALFAAGIEKDVSRKFVFNYLLYGVSDDMENPADTFYTAIKQLEPAHCITIACDGKLTKQKYWTLNYESNTHISIKEAVEQYRFLFRQSIERRLRSDVPVGSSLSGGIDSSSVVLEVNRIKGASQIQKTFSARFPGFVRDESVFMDMVNAKANVNPVSVFPTADSVMQNLKKIWFHQELPFGSTSVSIQYEVMRAARDNNVVVLLDGQGADETLAGYSFYRNTYLNELYKTNRQKYHAEIKALSENHNWKIPEQGMKQRIQKSGMLPIETLRLLRHKLLRPDSSVFLGIHPELVREFKGQPSPLPVFKSLKENLFYSTINIGLKELLRFADRNAMAHSVEVRLPFLSHELVEFGFSLPSSMLIQDGWSKYILRKSMEDLLPAKIAWRKDKVGYEPPQSEWFEKSCYKSIFNEAENFLLKEHIVQKPLPGFRWQYLMIAMLLRNDA